MAEVKIIKNLEILRSRWLFRYIQCFRKQLNITIQSLCKQSGVSPNTYRKMRTRSVRGDCYLRLLDGFRQIATPQEVNTNLLRVLMAITTDEDEKWWKKKK